MTERFDLAIVGGGIVGAAAARDAALRGIHTVVFDKGDVAGATSSASSKLAHGGIRYLEHLRLRLVRESLAEQKTLLAAAPHLVWRRRFLVPYYAGGRPAAYVQFGLGLYDWLARREPSLRAQRLSREDALRLEPALPPDGLRGAGLYHDAQMDDARLCLETLLDARAQSAVVRTYQEVMALERRGAEWLVRTRDTAADAGQGAEAEFTARVVLNATGPWVDAVRRMALGDCEPIVTWSRGSHLVVPGLTREHALLLTARADRRVFFVLPHGDVSLVGTTEVPHRDGLEALAPAPEEVQYLRREIAARWGEKAADGQAIRRVFAGVRPLARTRGALGAAPRDERMLEENGLVSVVGGKYTTHRAIAERVVDRVERLFGRAPAKCQTAKRLLPGGSWGDGAQAAQRARATWARESAPNSMTAEDAMRLGARYGSRFPAVLALAVTHGSRYEERAEGLAPVRFTVLEAEVVHAVRQELALRLDDAILRRLGLWADRRRARAALEPVARWMAAASGWSEARRAAEVERCERAFRAEDELVQRAGVSA